MKSDSFELLTALDEVMAMRVAGTLKEVAGVNKVAIQTTGGSVTADYDDGVTSKQELRAVLRNAGFDVKRTAHGEEGMCCGSCGS